ERLVEGVEEIGFAPGGYGEGVERVEDDGLVLCEVGEDVGVHVVGFDRDIVVGTKRLREAVGGVFHVLDEPPVGSGELDEQDGGDRRLDSLEMRDLLWDSVFIDAEVVFMKAGNELVILFKDHAYIDGNDRDIDLDGEVA